MKLKNKMKNLLFIFAFLSIASLSQAQQTRPVIVLSAGDHLIKAGNKLLLTELSDSISFLKKEGTAMGSLT